MFKGTHFLDHDEILRLQAAIVSAHLSGSRPALLAHISAEFAATLPAAPFPGEQVIMDLAALNAAGELVDGSVPLAIWLKNAVPLCGGRQEELIFAQALERVQSGLSNGHKNKPSRSTRHEAPYPAAIIHPHHGDTHMGSTTINITGSNVGAFAAGERATATGHVTIGGSGPITQEQHKAAITQAQNALNADQDVLERLDNRVYEALGQFLRMARKIQVEQKSLGEVQAKMKETLDEVWAQQVAKGMKVQVLPEGLKIVGALASNPVTAEVAKKLLGT